MCYIRIVLTMRSTGPGEVSENPEIFLFLFFIF